MKSRLIAELSVRVEALEHDLGDKLSTATDISKYTGQCSGVMASERTVSTSFFFRLKLVILGS